MYKLLSAFSLFIVVGCSKPKPHEEYTFQQKPDTLIHYKYNKELGIIENKIMIGYDSDCNFNDFAKKQDSIETNPK